MTLFFYPNFVSRAAMRLPSTLTFIASFHISTDKEVISISNFEAWVVKVICKVIVFDCAKSKDFSCLEYFVKGLNPWIGFGVIRRLSDPVLGFRFFDYSREGKHLADTYNLLAKSLCQIGQHDLAMEVVFDDEYLPDSSIIDSLVSSCGQQGRLDIAKKVLAQAYKSKITVNSFTFNKLLDILVKENRVDEAVSFFGEQHLRFGFCPDTYSFNIVIGGLCRIGQVSRAFEFFDDMENFDSSPDKITYNSLIYGLFRHNEVDKGRELLREMHLRANISPDVRTYTSAMSGCCKLGKMEDASILFDEMVSFGIRPNSFTYNVVIDGFGKAGNMGSAVDMYEKMLLMGCVPDVVTLTSLIDGHCRVGEVDEAMKLWHEMIERNVSPSAHTYSILINAFCKENRLSEARVFLRQLKSKSIAPKPFMYNPVIDGFCKAGNVDEANVIMKEMEENRCKPDKMTYTILIIGHCMKGRMSEAIGIFNKMLASNCAPDNITVNSLKTRLLKAGMPNEAHRLLLNTSKELDLKSSSSRKVHLLGSNLNVRVAV